jgi:hypothetical protein
MGIVREFECCQVVGLFVESWSWDKEAKGVMLGEKFEK